MSSPAGQALLQGGRRSDQTGWRVRKGPVPRSSVRSMTGVRSCAEPFAMGKKPPGGRGREEAREAVGRVDADQPVVGGGRRSRLGKHPRSKILNTEVVEEARGGHGAAKFWRFARYLTGRTREAPINVAGRWRNRVARHREA